jgi:hypothetical protein
VNGRRSIGSGFVEMQKQFGHSSPVAAVAVSAIKVDVEHERVDSGR